MTRLFIFYYIKRSMIINIASKFKPTPTSRRNRSLWYILFVVYKLHRNFFELLLNRFVHSNEIFFPQFIENV